MILGYDFKLIMISILNLRKKKFYRFLESLLAIISIGFLIILIILAWLNPTVYSILIIIYSFLWLLKFCLNVFYTIFSFKESNRWQTFDFTTFFDKKENNKQELTDLASNLQLNSQTEGQNSELSLVKESQKNTQIHDETLAQINYLQNFSNKN